MFERKKIVTPDIVLYNNFWLDESEEFYCLDTTYYILSNGDASEWYLLGVLNSDVVQFYYRRIAPTYKDEFLRYKSGYLKEIPVPDPNDCDEDIVGAIEILAGELQERVADYHKAQDIIDDPEIVLAQEDINCETLSLAAYVEKIELSDGDITDPYADGTTLQLNVQDSIEFTSKTSAEAFKRTVEIMEFESVNQISTGMFPSTEGDLSTFVDQYDTTANSKDAIEQEIKDLEEELNENVYDLFALDKEIRDYIQKTVKTPTTPIRPKAMSDEE